MGFQINYGETQERGLIAPGEYETIIKDAHFSTAPWGGERISIPLVVRNDRPQKHQNSIIWYEISPKREATEQDMACGGYSIAMVQRISQAAGLPNGKTYELMQAWLDDLNGKLLRVTVEHEEYDGRNGKRKRLRVRYTNATKAPDCKHVWRSAASSAPRQAASVAQAKQTTLQEQGFTQVDDDELPF